MPAIALHHRETGPSTAPAVVLGGSLGSTHTLWDELVADLSDDRRTIALDLRGHGASPSASGPVAVADLAYDVLALADRLGLERFDYVGLSLGGAVGQWLGLEHADRLRSLTLACTSPRFADAATWADRAALVRAEGVEPLREATAGRWFTDEVRLGRPDRVAQILDELVATDPESYAVLCEALGAFDVRDRLGRISVPTLVLTADQDPVSPPASTALLRDGVPGAREVVLEGAAHLGNVCRPAEFARAVRDHLERAST